MLRERNWIAVPVLALVVVAAMLVPSASSGHKGFKYKGSKPETIALPNGFQPEGIASTGNKEIFVGSIPTGAVWAGDVRTGTGAVRVPPHDGRAAIGIKVDKRDRLFVAGGMTGDAYVYDAESGADLARYDLAPEGATTFINDVVVTRKAAYFTDSRLQQLYEVPFGPGGALPAQSAVRTIPITGALVYVDGFNANGIVAAGHKRLIVVQTNTGKLFKVNRKTGVSREIDLGGVTVENGDGLLRRGRYLFVVQNQLNKITVFKLGWRLNKARLKATLTDKDFDVPTTITFAGRHLYAVNARFTTTPGPDVPYNVVKVR